MHRIMRLPLAVLGLAVLVSLTGCGGDSGGDKIKPYDTSSGGVAKPLAKPGSPADGGQPVQPVKGKAAGPGGGAGSQ